MHQPRRTIAALNLPRRIPDTITYARSVAAARTSGAALLVARAATTRASYDWQWSTDGTLWVDLERSVRADAALTGLTPGRRYYLRYRTLTKDGVADWSQVVSLLVR